MRCSRCRRCENVAYRLCVRRDEERGEAYFFAGKKFWECPLLHTDTMKIVSTEGDTVKLRIDFTRNPPLTWLIFYAIL